MLAVVVATGITLAFCAVYGGPRAGIKPRRVNVFVLVVEVLARCGFV